MKKNMLAFILVALVFSMVLSAQDAAVLFQEGNTALRKGDFNTAIAKFRDVLTLDPNFYFAYLNLGIAYRRQGNLDEAVLALDEAGKISQRDERFFGQYAHHLELGIVYMQKKSTDKAISEYKAAVEKLKNNSDPRNKPRYAKALVSLGEIYYFTKKDYKATYELLAGPHKSGIKDADLSILLAKSAAKLGKNAESIEYFKNSGIMSLDKLEEKDFYSLVEFWTSAIAQQDGNLAISIAKKLNDTGKPAKLNDDAIMFLARSYIFAGNHKSAVDALDKAIAANTDKPAEAYKLKGIAHFNSDDFAKAENALNTSIQKDKSDAEAYYYLGLALNKQEKRTEAKSAYETSLRLDPNYKAAKEALDIVNQQISQDEQKKAEEEEIQRLEEEERLRREEAERNRGYIR